MNDLVCLVADKSMEAAMDAVMRRPLAIGMRPIKFEIIVHPNRDPGCFHRASELLTGYRHAASHAMVLFDVAWDGAPTQDASDLELRLRERLAVAFGADWAEAVAIGPELEAWVFSDSPHVPAILGWSGRSPDLRTALANEGLWPADLAKPPDPKRAMERALTITRKALSSSIFREIATRVSLTRCEDRAFLRMKGILTSWFPSNATE